MPYLMGPNKRGENAEAEQRDEEIGNDDRA
jgi:hypothetical protein